MKGKILGSADANGVITGADGNRYKFTAADWKAPRTPKIGEEVDFEVPAAGSAGEIYPTHATAGFDLGDVGAKMGDVGAKMKEALGSAAQWTCTMWLRQSQGQNGCRGVSSLACWRARPASLLTSRLTVPLALVLRWLASFLFNYVSWSGEQLAAIGATSSGGYSVLGISSFSSNVGGFFFHARQTGQH